jgi:SAM-dependent methyltransferase
MGITARRRSDADRRIKVRHKFFHAPTIAQPRMTRLRSFEEFRSFIDSPANRQAEMTAFEAGLLGAETFTVPGYCAVCNRQTEFAVDYSWCAVHDGRRVPNWRERLECPGCHLNNRMRAAAGRLLSVSKPRDPIYLTEFISPLFQRVALKRRRAVGSEYLRDGTARGSTNAAGVRHEDVTRLTFPDAAFSAIGTFDVLEHVPDFRLALAEFFRCLRPAGAIVITAPFDLRSARTLTRATVDEAGTITHLLPPEFHWDPVDPGGALCFHHFGWDFIDALTETGFVDAGLSVFWDPHLGHLGGHQFVITAGKTAAPTKGRTLFGGLRHALRRSQTAGGVHPSATRAIAPQPGTN